MPDVGRDLLEADPQRIAARGIAGGLHSGFKLGEGGFPGELAKQQVRDSHSIMPLIIKAGEILLGNGLDLFAGCFIHSIQIEAILGVVADRLGEAEEHLLVVEAGGRFKAHHFGRKGDFTGGGFVCRSVVGDGGVRFQEAGGFCAVHAAVSGAIIVVIITLILF